MNMEDNENFEIVYLSEGMEIEEESITPLYSAEENIAIPNISTDNTGNNNEKYSDVDPSTNCFMKTWSERECQQMLDLYTSNFTNVGSSMKFNSTRILFSYIANVLNRNFSTSYTGLEVEKRYTSMQSRKYNGSDISNAELLYLNEIASDEKIDLHPPDSPEESHVASSFLSTNNDNDNTEKSDVSNQSKNIMYIKKWTQAETKRMINLYKSNINNVGTFMKFKNKKSVFAHIANQLTKEFNMKFTGVQVNNRYKTLYRRTFLRNRKNKKNISEADIHKEIMFSEELMNQPDSTEQHTAISGITLVDTTENSTDANLSNYIMVTKWSEELSKQMLNLYSSNIHNIGTGMKFKSKRSLYEYIASELNKEFNVKLTAIQVENRYKTMLKQYPTKNSKFSKLNICIPSKPNINEIESNMYNADPLHAPIKQELPLSDDEIELMSSPVKQSQNNESFKVEMEETNEKLLNQYIVCKKEQFEEKMRLKREQIKILKQAQEDKKFRETQKQRRHDEKMKLIKDLTNALLQRL